MTEEQCIINKVSVEVNARTSMDTDTLQREVYQLIEETILQRIDEYLSRKSESLKGQSVRIDTLNLDLDFGSVDRVSSLEAERMIDRQLDRFFHLLNLQEATARLEQESIQANETNNLKTERGQNWRTPGERLAGTSSNGKPVELLSANERKMETLLHFLLEGTTPWWISSSDEMRSIVQDEKLIELLQNSAVLRFQFQQFLHRPRFFERFIAQFSPTTVARVLLFLAHEKWTDMVSFQKTFLAPLERLRQFTRAERVNFWVNFHKATAIQFYVHWKEKVVLESHRSFAERVDEPGKLLPALEQEKLNVPSEIAALTVFMLEFKGRETIDMSVQWKELLNELDEDTRVLLLPPTQSPATKRTKRGAKKDEPFVGKTSTAKKQKMEMGEPKTSPDQAEETSMSSPASDRDADLAQRFENYRKRMEARWQRQKSNKRGAKKENEDATERDPDEVWDELFQDDSENTNAETKESNAAETILPEQGWIAGQVGILLIHPFLKAFCTRWELLDESKQLKHPEEMAHILHFMATGREHESEFELTFEKFLCGLDANTVLEKGYAIPEEMKTNIDELLQSAITHWSALKGTSVAGLRSGFLMRPGKIVIEENRIQITVERHAIDILIDRLPWTLSYLKVPWRKEIIQITW